MVIHFGSIQIEYERWHIMHMHIDHHGQIKFKTRTLNYRQFHFLSLFLPFTCFLFELISFSVKWICWPVYLLLLYFAKRVIWHRRTEEPYWSKLVYENDTGCFMLLYIWNTTAQQPATLINIMDKLNVIIVTFNGQMCLRILLSTI